MIRGTTPTLTFELPFECSLIDSLSIAFSQTPATYKPPELLLEKTLGDVAVSGSTITLTLSQEDTLKLDAAHDVEIQLRVLCGDTAMASQIIRTPVRRILRVGVLA